MNGEFFDLVPELIEAEIVAENFQCLASGGEMAVVAALHAHDVVGIGTQEIAKLVVVLESHVHRCSPVAMRPGSCRLVWSLATHVPV